MRKGLALAPLAAIAVMAAGAWPAAADETFEGKCGTEDPSKGPTSTDEARNAHQNPPADGSLAGTATFDKPLKGTSSPNGYHFLGGGTCVGKLNGIDVSGSGGAVAVKIDGTGNLSCARSTSTGDGPGSLTFTNRTPGTADDVTLQVNLEFEAGASEVFFNLKGAKSGNAQGKASFARLAPMPETAQQCEDPDPAVGVSELGFTAFASTSYAGATLVSPSGAAPATPTGGGDTGGGGGGGGGGDTGGGGPTQQGQAALSASLKPARTRLKRALRKGIPLRFTANRPSRVSLRATVSRKVARKLRLVKAKRRARAVKVGRGRGNLTSAGTRTVRVRFTRKAKRRLRRARRVKVAITGSVVDVTKSRRRVRTSVTLRR